ncbi:putative prophage CPZ-55 integrase [Roseibium sp. TrichSKD4]|nr:putative prophage CPZ-55 integrase [Roseibium sp. TrichSKD4]
MRVSGFEKRVWPVLSDAKIRKTKVPEKPQKLADSYGLHLYLTPAGGKFWRYRYRYEGKEKLPSLGEYPHVSLADARALRDEARAILVSGNDPSKVKKAEKSAAAIAPDRSFEAIARDWHKLNETTWTEKHRGEVLTSLEVEVFPTLGKLPIDEITALQVLETLRKIEARGAKEKARRVRQRMSAVFVYGIAMGICENDPAAQVQKAMAPLKKGRQPAVTDLLECREIIKRVETTPGHPVTKLAHRLLAITALRPGALINTPWSELNGLDEEDPVWVLPAERMKMRLHLKNDDARDHLIPLPAQAVEIIDALRKFSGRQPFAFPNSRHAHKPMSENAIGYLLNRAGYHHKHVPHGWRSSFSTIMNERHPDSRAIIDFTLAHVPKDKVEAAYNRALYLKQRRELLQEWANILLVDQMPISEVVKTPRRVFKSK